jgi:hypothetical protein
LGFRSAPKPAILPTHQPRSRANKAQLFLAVLDRHYHFAANHITRLEGIDGMARTRIFIEPRADGGFGAKHEGGKRAVITAETQGEVISETKAKYPDAEIHVARVRHTGPGPDKFRKI